MIGLNTNDYVFNVAYFVSMLASNREWSEFTQNCFYLHFESLFLFSSILTHSLISSSVNNSLTHKEIEGKWFGFKEPSEFKNGFDSTET